MDINIDEFEKLVLEVLRDLPNKFRDKFENIEFIIEDESLRPQNPDKPAHSYYTLGLYHGVPVTSKSHSGQRYPDRIIIYKKSIEAVCRDMESLKKTVRKVVLHEIGHYFGIGEKRLRELGY